MSKRNNYIREYKLWTPVATSVVVTVMLPLILSVVTLPQALTVKGTYVANDSRVFHRFVEDIKSANGVLVLGTSETGNELDGYNYWGFLNRDKDIGYKFSVLGGAGRDYSVYLPIIVGNPELFRGLKVLVYINPTYWRETLCKFDNSYFTRYVGRDLALRVKDDFMERGLFDKFLKPVMFDDGKIDSLEYSFNDELDKYVADFKTYFSYDLKRVISDDQQPPPKTRKFELMSTQQLDSLKAGINLEFNAVESFLATGTPFPAIAQGCSFRYDALYEFINLCDEFDVDVTFYLGPYNGVYCEKKNPEHRASYEEVIADIKMLVKGAEIPLIDGSGLSNTTGTFLDVQHISKYGAYLTAQQIKEYYATTNPDDY